MRAVMLGVLGCLAACNDGGKGGSENVDIGIMKSRIEILEGRVSRLENRQPADYAFLKPGDKNWTWISNGAYSLRVGISNVAESGSGSKVRLDIQNPLAISLQDCEIDLLWGRLTRRERRSKAQSTKSSLIFRVVFRQETTHSPNLSWTMSHLKSWGLLPSERSSVVERSRLSSQPSEQPLILFIARWSDRWAVGTADMRLHPSPFRPARPAAQAVRSGDQIGLPPARDEQCEQWLGFDRPFCLAPLAADTNGKASGDDLVQIVSLVAFISAVVVPIHSVLIQESKT